MQTQTEIIAHLRRENERLTQRYKALYHELKERVGSFTLHSDENGLITKIQYHTQVK
jgi:hypothetical protein